MSARNFIRENLVLLMGISLPVLLVVLFFLTSVLPKSFTEPPQHELLFSVIRYDYQAATAPNFEFIVRDGVLKARVGKNDNSPNVARYSRKLLAYDGRTESIREIPYDLAQISRLAENEEITLQETGNMTIAPSTHSPDGYNFEGPAYGGGGLMGEVFFGGYRNQGYRIVKGRAAYKIPSTFGEAYYAGNLQFIGWVAKK